jgi:arylsulfatase A-like enzyme
MDDQIGQVLRSLKSNRFEDNTIVAIIGDHGWALGENQVLLKSITVINNSLVIFNLILRSGQSLVTLT